MSPGGRTDLPLAVGPYQYLQPAEAGVARRSAATDASTFDLADEPILWLSVPGAPATAGTRPAEGREVNPTPSPAEERASGAGAPTLPATGSALPLPVAALLAALGWLLRRGR